FAAIARIEQPFGETGLAANWSIYVQALAGLGVGRTRLTNAQAMTYDDTHFGPATGFGAGLHFESGIAGLGMTAGYSLEYAPVIKDLIGNTHGSGGGRGSLSFTYSF